MFLHRGAKFGIGWRVPLCRHYASTSSQNANFQRAQTRSADEEYLDTPEYPQIHDLSFKERKVREALSWQQEIQNTPTVEEKLLKINMPRYYGHKVVQMSDERLPYNCLPAIQHYTRTLFETVGSESKDEDEKILSYVEAVKEDVLGGLELAHDYFSHQYPKSLEMDSVERERLLSQIIVEQINRALINGLSSEFPHLSEVEVDYNPRHEAFWSVGGIEPPKNVVKSKEGHEWQKDMAHDVIDRFMQYKSSPMLALRHRQQLSPWKTENEYTDLELAKSVPRFKYDPRTLGFVCGHQHGTNIPGYWPSNMTDFGLISFQTRAPLQIRPQNYGDEEHMNALHAHAIQSSFAWLLAQANYLGFNTYSELTYPMNTQTIITSGKKWSFYEYQLNTLLMSGRQIDENPRVNCCRGTNEMSLYEDVDEKGQIIGFNENTLKHLIKCYTKIPSIQRPDDELTPYLDNRYKRIADYPDEDKRDFLEKAFKHMVSNRPRHLELPEIYMWEKIYKIDNNTRPLEARRRFFEVFVNPWKRTLDQHQKEYIPKAVRPEGPKSRKKWKPTYYP